MTALIGVVLAVDCVLALSVIAIYSLFAPWWSTRAGRAIFALYVVFGAIVVHLAAEAAFGQGPDWYELVLASAFGVVILWNGYTIASKQIRARRSNEEGH